MWKIIPSDAKTPILTRCDLTELEAAKEAKMKGASFLTLKDFGGAQKKKFKVKTTKRTGIDEAPLV
jgi:hypothetical protein